MISLLLVYRNANDVGVQTSWHAYMHCFSSSTAFSMHYLSMEGASS